MHKMSENSGILNKLLMFKIYFKKGTKQHSTITIEYENLPASN